MLTRQGEVTDGYPNRRRRSRRNLDPTGTSIRSSAFPATASTASSKRCAQRQDEIRFIQVRHEEAAAFNACAYAKWTGKLGVCLATSGPGGIHLLNGLYDAKLDGQPVLAITGLQFHDLLHTFTQQDVELDKLFMDVCVYNTRIMGPQHVENVGRARLPHGARLSRRRARHHAGRHAVASRSARARAPSATSPDHVSDVMARVGADAERARSSREAVDILNAGKKIVILAGRGALGAGDALTAVAERLAAPIIKPLLGKGAVADDSPYCTGGIGLLGTKPSQEALEECDTLLIAGIELPLHRVLPQARQGQGRADRHRSHAHRLALSGRGRPGRRRRTACCSALLPQLDQREDRSFLEKAQAGMKEWNELMEERGTRTRQADEAAGGRPRAQQAA